MPEKEIKIPIISTDTTSGLVSATQLMDTTASEIFAKTKDETSETETEQIMYLPMTLPQVEEEREDQKFLPEPEV